MKPVSLAARVKTRDCLICSWYRVTSWSLWKWQRCA